MTAVLELVGVSRHYQDGDRTVAALDGVDLTIAAGELVAITGRSGVGKSTLINLAGGLDRPSSGEVLVEGTDLATLKANDLAAMRRRSLGFVFQSGNLIPTLTAAENVALPLELDGVSVRDAMTQARNAIASVADPALADRYPDQLSGGEQQRVAVARALTGERRLLLADEPTGALDEVSAEGVLRLIRQRCDDGASALMVTHDPAQAAWADRVVRLRDGAIESITETGRTVEVSR